MNYGYKRFSISVIVAVIVVGAGFGSLTGLAYSQTLWWIGTIVGGLCGYPLARIYLRSLERSRARGSSGLATWLSGTFVATLCGILCTVVVHVTMMATSSVVTPITDTELGSSLWPVFLFFGVQIGAGAGFVVGGICSLVFSLYLKAPGHETK